MQLGGASSYTDHEVIISRAIIMEDCRDITLFIGNLAAVSICAVYQVLDQNASGSEVRPCVTTFRLERH